MFICVFRFPLPACADSAILPLHISGNNSQTHLHHEQWFQYWRLLGTLVPAEAREPCSVSPVLLVRLRYAPGLFPSHFSGSKDASANAGHLLISGLQPEDEADYYCDMWLDRPKAHPVLHTHEEVRCKPPSTLLALCHWNGCDSDQVCFRE
uniref:Immunoglobulin V-set domain-containing protein n=1 Tax=Equus asinus TaxID=9793 RepID=A0A9L0ID85_EQUAS